MAATGGMSRDRAEWIAAQALRFIATDGDRLARFIGLTGINAGEIRENLDQPVFLAGILDYLLEDESLLLECVESAGCAPEEPAMARAVLAGLTD